jgi:hypothetical protein
MSDELVEMAEFGDAKLLPAGELQPVPCHTRPLDCFQNGCFCAGCITGFSVSFILFTVLFALSQFDNLENGSGHEGHVHQTEVAWTFFW